MDTQTAKLTAREVLTPDAIDAMVSKMETAGYSSARSPGSVRNLAAWLVADRARLSRRGVLLTGEPGTGKTMWMQLCAPVDRIHTASRIVDAYGRQNDEATYREWLHGTYSCGTLFVAGNVLGIDDMGTEPASVRYGQREEYMATVICERYELWQRHGIRTFVTTNLSMPEIGERYGARIVDRMSHMLYHVTMTGHSWRTEGGE